MTFSNVTLLLASPVFLIYIPIISALPAEQYPGNGNNPGRPQAPGFQNAGAQGNQQQQVYQNGVLNPPSPQRHEVPQNYYPPVNGFRRFHMEYVFPDQIPQHVVPENYYPPVNRYRRRYMNYAFPNQIEHQKPPPPPPPPQQ